MLTYTVAARGVSREITKQFTSFKDALDELEWKQAEARAFGAKIKRHKIELV